MPSFNQQYASVTLKTQDSLDQNIQTQDTNMSIQSQFDRKPMTARGPHSNVRVKKMKWPLN